MGFSHDTTLRPEMIDSKAIIRYIAFAVPTFAASQVDELRAQVRPIRGLLEQFCELGLIRSASRNALLEDGCVA
jgi:hypothetical protein